MNIQAINSINGTHSCQPLKPINFAGKKDKVPSFAKEVLANDLIVLSPADLSVKDVDTYAAQMKAEEKFNVACDIAGYYKQQYENLLKSGLCIA